MTEIGKVLKVKGEFATVRIGRHSACGSCGKCGIGKKNLHVDFSASNPLNAQVGDTVKLEIKEFNTLKLSLVAYVMPLALGLAMFFLGVLLELPDYANLLLLVAGLAIAFFFVWLINKFKKNKWAESPIIVSIEENPSEHNLEHIEVK